jgi:hypothetical protein
MSYFKIVKGKYCYDYSKMSLQDLSDRAEFHRSKWRELGEDRTNGSEGKHHLTMMRVLLNKNLIGDPKKYW